MLILNYKRFLYYKKLSKNELISYNTKLLYVCLGIGSLDFNFFGNIHIYLHYNTLKYT